MARPFPVAVRAETPRPAESIESRLEVLARPLRKLAREEVAREFSLPNGAALLKTTLSLCPACLTHVPAAVYVESGRVLMAKRCGTHGITRAVIENDERYYRLSTKDRGGRAYDPSRLDHVPAYDWGCRCDSEY